jgi:Zn-finger nucleic acid-binding protein
MRLKSDMNSLKCEYCQSAYFPEKNDDGVRVLDEATDQNCSLCNIPLMHASIVNVLICYCTNCRGMAIPMAVFENLVAILRSQKDTVVSHPRADNEDLRRKINCTHCHKRMETHFYGGPGNVVIDSCENCCLIWLDAGELMRIATASDVPVASTAPLPSSATYSDDQNQSSFLDSTNYTDGPNIVADAIDALFL